MYEYGFSGSASVKLVRFCTHAQYGDSNKLHGPSMFAVEAKIYGVLYNQASSIAFDETSSYWSALKAPDFSAFHWSPRGNLISIGQHFVITRVVHLPKRTEASLITEA